MVFSGRLSTMNRVCLAILLTTSAVSTAYASEKAPFRVLFSNDTTNITSNTSPFHERGEPFGPEKLEASVDETVGCADVHMLQPGGGWVPWWKSEVCPTDEHYRWLKEKAGVPGVSPDSLTIGSLAIDASWSVACSSRAARVVRSWSA